MDHRQAACLDMPDTFCGPSEGTLSRSNRQVAIQVCLTCPIKAECLADAMTRIEYDTVRGGVYFDKYGQPQDPSLNRVQFWTNCVHCGTEFTGHSLSRYCDKRCRQRAFTVRKRESREAA